MKSCTSFGLVMNVDRVKFFLNKMCGSILPTRLTLCKKKVRTILFANWFINRNIKLTLRCIMRTSGATRIEFYISLSLFLLQLKMEHFFYKKNKNNHMWYSLPLTFKAYKLLLKVFFSIASTSVLAIGRPTWLKYTSLSDSHWHAEHL